MTPWPIWERGVYSDPDRGHEVPSICWNHHDAHMSWRADAACADSGVDFFDPNQTNQALMLCHGCPVADECLREALSVGTKDDPAGVWGGHTKAERDRMRQRGRRKPLEPCGSYGAYRRHKDNGETACDACLEANRKAQADYRAGKRKRAA